MGRRAAPRTVPGDGGIPDADERLAGRRFAPPTGAAADGNPAPSAAAIDQGAYTQASQMTLQPGTGIGAGTRTAVNGTGASPRTFCQARCVG